MLSQSHLISAQSAHYTIHTRVFGANDSPRLQRKLEISERDLLKPVEEMFLNDASATAALERATIVGKVNNLVSFSSVPETRQHWERSAHRSSRSQPEDAVTVDLQELLRNLGACIAIPLLYGQDFLDRYTDVLDDFWRFDNDAFPLLMVGVPPWAPFKMMREGILSRSRLSAEMTALYRRIDQYQKGTSVDFEADLSDVSAVALARNAIYDRDGWTFEERGGLDLVLLWAVNANTNPLIFWTILYIHSTPGLVSTLREEVAPYVDLSDPVAQEDYVRLKAINFSGISSHCTLLKACVYETYRMANEATSIRQVTKPVSIVNGGVQQQLKTGTFISVPHSINQRDSDHYPDPHKFIPTRFLVEDPDTGSRAARYGKLRPWATGANMCKGRTFAEREIMSLTAAIITAWDITPADDAEWTIPDMVPGTGAKKPLSVVKATFKRRKIE